MQLYHLLNLVDLPDSLNLVAYLKPNACATVAHFFFDEQPPAKIGCQKHVLVPGRASGPPVFLERVHMDGRQTVMLQ